ncbi:hypothetical protein [Microbacterium sp.]|uniref:hypothetical protein n=1 Tax=Microbacterium sp. TaxID=51671 RepID=UPI00261C76BE|nr:hypothetical protein [Microbacterium sp.]
MNRHEATRRVMRKLMQPESKSRLRVVADDGSTPIVVCTPNEYLSDVIARVDLIGGRANVVYAEVKRFRVFSIRAVENDGSDQSETTGHNADMSMGMFMIKHVAAGKNVFRVKSGAELAVSPAEGAFSYA